MINKPELKSRLRLFALPTGTDYRMVEALRDNPVADITDDGNRLLYQASPDEFFALYGNGTTIINAHAFDSVTLSALQFLSHHPLTDLVLAGRFSKAALRLFRESADNLGVVLDINATPEPRLFTTKMVNGVAAALPGDLFYGQVTLKSTSTKASAETLKIERKVSSISLITKGVIKVLDSREGNFYYKVKKTKASFDHNGELTGEEIEYIIPATMDAKGNVIADNTAILPASDVTIELYKDDNMILSSKNVKNSEKVSVNEGEQSEITFDLSKNNCNIVVADWGTVITHVTIG